MYSLTFDAEISAAQAAGHRENGDSLVPVWRRISLAR